MARCGNDQTLPVIPERFNRESGGVSRFPLRACGNNDMGACGNDQTSPVIPERFNRESGCVSDVGRKQGLTFCMRIVNFPAGREPHHKTP